MTNKSRKRGGRGKKGPASAPDIPEECLFLSLAHQGPVVNLPEAVGIFSPAVGSEQQATADAASPSHTEVQLASWSQLGPLLTWFKQQLAADGSAVLTFSPRLPKDLRAHVHNTVSGMKGLETISDGVGEERAVSVVAQGAAPRTRTPAAVKDAGVALWRLAQEAGLGARYSRDEVVAMMGGDQLPDELQRLWEGPLGRQQVLLHQLCTAASCGEVPQVQQLLSDHPGLLQGNVQDLSCGALPLHLAAAGGYEEVVRLLLGAGADVHALDSNSKTALQVAQAAEECTIEALLLQAGAVNSQQDSWQGLMAPQAVTPAAASGNGLEAAAPTALGATSRGLQPAVAAAAPASKDLQQQQQQQQQGGLPAAEVLCEDNTGFEDQEQPQEEDAELAAALEGLLTITRLAPTTAAAAASAGSDPQSAGSSSGAAAGSANKSEAGAPVAGQQQEVLGEELLCEDSTGAEGLSWGAAEGGEDEEDVDGGEDDPAAAAALEGLLTVRRLVPVAAAAETTSSGAAAAAGGDHRVCSAVSGAAGSSSVQSTVVCVATAEEPDASAQPAVDAATTTTTSSNPIQGVLQQVAQQVQPLAQQLQPLAQQLQRAASSTWSTTRSAAVDGWSNATNWVQEQLPPNVKQQLQQLAGGDGQHGDTLPAAVLWGGVAVAGALAVGGIIALGTGSRRRRARRR